MPPFDEYRFDAALTEGLRQYAQNSSKGPSAIKAIVGEILTHIGMIRQWVEVKVTYADDINNNNAATGMYNEAGFLYGEINILIKPQYDVDAIIAIACHECAHHFLYKRKATLSDKDENERLTDLATIYMGFDEYMKRAYTVRQVDSHHSAKLGYLNSSEMSYAHVVVERLRLVEEMRMELVGELRTDIKGRIANLEADIIKNKTVIETIDRFDTAYNAAGYLKLINENYELLQNGEIHKWASAFFQRLENPGITVKDLKLLQNEIEDYRTRLHEYNKAVNMLIQLSQFQSSLSEEALSSLKKLHADALLDDANSLVTLIQYYLSIPGFSDDAMYYFEILSKCQNAEGYCYIGDCYYSGILTEKNIKLAKYYYYNAMHIGSSAAKEKYENLIQMCGNEV